MVNDEVVFVLKVESDPIAMLAMRCYAVAARSAGLEYLADDITTVLDEIEKK